VSPDRPDPTLTEGAALDPRIRARRIAIRRQQGRRRLRVLLVLVGLVALAGLGYAAAQSALLDVGEVRVRGNVRTPGDDVLIASDLHAGDPLLLLDVDGASEAVDRLPWIRSAKVVRSWNGTVTIRVTEREPVAHMQVEGGGWVLVDADGRQLERDDGFDPAAAGTLRLTGVSASGVVGTPVSPEAQSVLRLHEALTPPVREAVDSMGLDGSDLVLELTGGGRVRLGDASDLDAKLVSLETMLARVDLTCLAELDLGVPSAPALTRRPPPPPDEDAQHPLSELSQCP
jgi:cell division protein FtsQ